MYLWGKLQVLTIIPTFIIFVISAFFIGKLLNNKSEKIKYIPFQIIAVLILLLEIGKQINSIDFETLKYSMYSLPFHYCSLFLYLLPLHAFYHGKYQKYIEKVTYACGASLLFMMLVVPNVIYSDNNIKNFFKDYSDMHTVFFHNIVCFYFILMIFLKTHIYNFKEDGIVSTIFLSMYFIIATILSYSLDVNFHNIKHCNLALIENIRLALVDSIGIFGQVIYLIILYIGTLGISIFASYIIKCLQALFKKIFIR